MDQNIAIHVGNVGKAYHIWEAPSARITAPLQDKLASLFPRNSRFAQRLLARAAASHRDFWALKDVSFEVRKGESVGIIGRNGSGKSTLLQIIAGTLQPTAGAIRASGRVAALLELGSGFNPDFTGRENVMLNGAILGLSRAEMLDKFESIAAFADIGEFIEQPVKTYSSGMMVRLAFAVQTAVEPDILIVDEALSVGDFFFQQKCFKRIAELRGRGTTILFVSHDMASVRDLCSQALYLSRGEAIFFGDSQQAIARYYREDDTAGRPTPSVLPAERSIPVEAGRLVTALAHAIWKKDPNSTPTDAPAELLAVEVLDGNGRPAMKHRMGGSVVIRGYFRAQTAADVHVALELKNRHGQLVSSLGSRVHGSGPASLQPGQTWCFEAQVQLGLEAGLYSFQVCLGRPHAQPNLGVRFAESPWLGPLTIDWDYNAEPAPFLGMFHLPARIAVEEVR